MTEYNFNLFQIKLKSVYSFVFSRFSINPETRTKMAFKKKIQLLTLLLKKSCFAVVKKTALVVIFFNVFLSEI